jgi:hypothetical protein
LHLQAITLSTSTASAAIATSTTCAAFTTT